MKNIRKACDSNESLKEALQDSVQAPIIPLSSIFQKLELKGEAFKNFSPCSEEAITDLEAKLQQTDLGLSAKITKAQASKMANFQRFFDAHCISRQYSFSVLKCQDDHCPFHKPPRLEDELFKELRHLPDGMISSDGVHYMAFGQLYGKDTVEEQKPSRSSSSSKEGHGLLFNPSAQTAGRLKRTVTCKECDKPRVLHAAKKLKKPELEKLDRALDATDFTCETTAQDLAAAGHPASQAILSQVYIRSDLRCADTVEISYYSSAAFPQICCYCACSNDLVSGEDAVDMYTQHAKIVSTSGPRC